VFGPCLHELGDADDRPVSAILVTALVTKPVQRHIDDGEMVLLPDPRRPRSRDDTPSLYWHRVSSRTL